MSRRSRAGVLVGLLVASVLVGAAGTATASQTDASALVDAEAGVHAADGTLDSLQSADNESVQRQNTTIDHDGEQVTLTAAASETISGESDVAPGTTLSVQVQSEDPQSPFIVTNETTVADDGTFSRTVDLSNVQADTPVAVQVRNGSATLARASGEVVRCTGNCSGPEQWPQFESGIISERRGGDAEVTIDVPDDVEGPVNATIGDEEAGFLVETTVSDADDDGEVVLTLNTSLAGNGAPSEYLSAGEDWIDAAEQHSAELSSPLDAGFYDLALGPSEAPYDVATLNLEDPDREGTGTDGTNEGDEANGSDAVGEIDVNNTGEVTFITAGDGLELGNAEDRRITAETELAAGSTVDLRLSSRDPSNPFLRTASATVTEYGTFNTTVDLGDVAAGSEFELVATHDGETVGATAGRVVACDGDCPRTTSAANQSASPDAGEDDRNESNVVDVDDDGGSIPLEAIGAIAVGGLLSLVGVVRFTGIVDR